MERRAYFIFGDLLACAASGAAAGWITFAVVPGDWFAIIGMMLGMALGMLAGTVVGFFFAPFFGDFEIALPAGLSGMTAGAAVGMLRGMAGIDAAAALLGGAVAGLACLAYTYLLQARLHGEAK